MSKETGGHAFPYEDDNEYYYGMTLRDYFAGQVLTGIAASDRDLDFESEKEYASMFCYRLADAMLKERSK